MIFKGSNTQQDFCKWLINKQHKDFTAITHNARGYDSYFIYDYLIENSHTPHPLIFSGSKIMCMSVPTGGLNIRFLDSLNFLPMPLAQLPKSFGLEELKKGFFLISSTLLKIKKLFYCTYLTSNIMTLTL